MTPRRLDPPLACGDREPGTRISTVLLHSTATRTLGDAIRILRERNLSYHYLVDRDGATLEAVPWYRQALHAGESTGPDGPAMNRTSIGVSLVNLNDGMDPYPATQLRGLIDLLNRLRQAEPNLVWLTSHAIVAPGRKNDPLGLDLAPLAQAADLTLWTPTTG